MKNTFVLLASLFVSTTAFAQFGGGDFPKQTKIENANYFCGDNKGAFALKVNDPARVWQTELNAQGVAESGLELTVNDIVRFRSPHHFDIKASMQAGDEKINYHFNMSANHVTKVITLETTISNENSDETVLAPVPCTLVPDIPDNNSKPREQEEKKYSFDDIDVSLVCESKLAKIPDFYILGRVKDKLTKPYQVFFNIEGELTLDNSMQLESNENGVIKMNGGFLTYAFDLNNQELSIINREGVLAGSEACRTY